MSMTLDGFIGRAFPLDGQLEQTACGHSFLNRYSDNDILNLDPNFGFRLEVSQRRVAYVIPIVRGDSTILIGPETRNEEAKGSNPYPPSRFERNEVYRSLGRAFQERLKGHLMAHLGTRYAEFEQRLSEETYSSPIRISVAHVSRLSTIAWEVNYLAVAEREIIRLRNASVDAFIATVQTSAARGGASPSEHICVRCVDRDTYASVAERYRAIIESAPAAYKSYLSKLVNAATSEVTAARDNAVKVRSTRSALPCGRDDMGGGQLAPGELVMIMAPPGPCREQDIDADASGSDSPLDATVVSTSLSLLQRLLCCWRGAPSADYQALG